MSISTLRKWFLRDWRADVHYECASLGFTENSLEKEKMSSERQSCGQKCLVGVRGQGRMGWVVRGDRKATVTQITTRYNRRMQNTISERTARGTLRQTGSSSRTPHRAPSLFANNRKLRLQSAQAHQNWLREDWKNSAWSDESQYKLRHSQGSVGIWHKQRERMDSSCLVSTVQMVVVW